MSKFTYSAIDDITTKDGSRVCFYFGFNSEAISFAAKKLVAEEITHFKSENYYDVFAWLGFNVLSEALYNSQKFRKKYRINCQTVIKDKLIVGTINDKPIFFLTLDDGKNWSWSEDFSDLLPVFGENIENSINQALGSDFLKNYWIFIDENAAQKKVYEDYIRLKQECIGSTKSANSTSQSALLDAS